MEAHKFYRVLAIVIMIASVGTVMAIMQYAYHVIFKGEIATVKIGVYWDPDCTNPVPESFPINQTLYEGQNNFTVYVKNEGWYNTSVTMNFSGYWPDGTTITLETFTPMPVILENRGDIAQIDFSLTVTINVEELNTTSYEVYLDFIGEKIE